MKWIWNEYEIVGWMDHLTIGSFWQLNGWSSVYANVCDHVYRIGMEIKACSIDHLMLGSLDGWSSGYEHVYESWYGIVYGIGVGSFDHWTI